MIPICDDVLIAERGIPMPGTRHVVYTTDGWQHTQGRSGRRSRVFANLRDAEADARRVARQNDETVFVHAEEGAIRRKGDLRNDQIPRRF